MSQSPSSLMLALIVVAPFVAYPFFVMQMLCIALFACAFNLLIGYVGLLSFGHAMFLRHGELCLRARREGLGPRSGACDPLRRRRARPRWGWSPARSRSAARASISR